MQRGDRFLRFPFIQQKLRQLLDAVFVCRFAREQVAQNGFGLVLLVLQAVQAREPERGIGVGGIEAKDFAVLLGGVRERVVLPGGVAQIAERAHVDSREQAARGQIVRVLGENRIRFGHRVANPLGLVIDFGKLVADLLAVRIERERLLQEIDGLVGVFRVAADLIFLRVIMAHHEIVIGFGCAWRFRPARRTLRERVCGFGLFLACHAPAEGPPSSKKRESTARCRPVFIHSPQKGLSATPSRPSKRILNLVSSPELRL